MGVKTRSGSVSAALRLQRTQLRRTRSHLSQAVTKEQGMGKGQAAQAARRAQLEEVSGSSGSLLRPSPTAVVLAIEG